MTVDATQLLARARDAGWAVEPLARAYLQDQGVPTARFGWAHTADEALDIAAEIGYPVVAKIVSPEVVHKSDVGGVAVGLRDAGELAEAFARMSLLPGFDGIVVDELIAGGVELIVGAKHDPQFGTVVLAGIGGTAVEVYQDVAIRMAPVTADGARDALASLRGKALLAGHRGAPAPDLDALASLIARFSEVAFELGDRITSMECNPVIATPERAVVCDGRIMLGG